MDRRGPKVLQGSRDSIQAGLNGKTPSPVPLSSHLETQQSSGISVGATLIDSYYFHSLVPSAT